MSTELLERPKLDGGDTDNPENVAHIIQGTNPKALITWAIVEGKELTALCGKRFKPSRDAEGLPVCQPCLDVKRKLMGRHHNVSGAG